MPPSLGGKSLVTSRCFIGSRLGAAPRADRGRRHRRPRAGRRGRAAGPPTRRAPAAAGSGGAGAPRAPPPRPPSPPSPMLPSTTSALRRRWSGSRRGMYQRPWRASSSSSEARSRSSTGTDAPRRRRRRPRPATRPGGSGGWAGRPPGSVAAVDAVAERGPVLDREHPGGLHQPGQAAAGVDHAGGDDGAGRAAVDAPRARPAPVGHRLRGGLEVGVGEDRAEHEPAPLPGQQQVRALAVPAQTGAVGGLAVHEAVVVHQGAGGVARLGEHGRRPRPGRPGARRSGPRSRRRRPGRWWWRPDAAAGAG